MTLSEGLARLRVWAFAIGLGLSLTILICFLEKYCWRIRLCTFNRKVAEQIMTQVEVMVREKESDASYQSALRHAVQLLSMGAEERPVHVMLRSISDVDQEAQSHLESSSELFNDASGLFQYWKIFHSHYEVKVTVHVEPWRFLGLPQLWMNDLALVVMFILFTSCGVVHANRLLSGRKLPTPEGGKGFSSA